MCLPGMAAENAIPTSTMWTSIVVGSQSRLPWHALSLQHPLFFQLCPAMTKAPCLENRVIDPLVLWTCIWEVFARRMSISESSGIEAPHSIFHLQLAQS
jgi:hypothetical protein